MLAVRPLRRMRALRCGEAESGDGLLDAALGAGVTPGCCTGM
ncbi:hypothetical protein SANTM175S_09524 [Streptomyces antimycoticus]